MWLALTRTNVEMQSEAVNQAVWRALVSSTTLPVALPTRPCGLRPYWGYRQLVPRCGACGICGRSLGSGAPGLEGWPLFSFPPGCGPPVPCPIGALLVNGCNINIRAILVCSYVALCTSTSADVVCVYEYQCANAIWDCESSGLACAG